MHKGAVKNVFSQGLTQFWTRYGTHGAYNTNAHTIFLANELYATRSVCYRDTLKKSLCMHYSRSAIFIANRTSGYSSNCRCLVLFLSCSVVSSVIPFGRIFFGLVESHFQLVLLAFYLACLDSHSHMGVNFCTSFFLHQFL